MVAGVHGVVEAPPHAGTLTAVYSEGEGGGGGGCWGIFCPEQVRILMFASSQCDGISCLLPRCIHVFLG